MTRTYDASLQRAVATDPPRLDYARVISVQDDDDEDESDDEDDDDEDDDVEESGMPPGWSD
jgi:hypothetical protein